VVAGAGLAGGTLALRLARAGARVALVDPARFPRDKLCGEYLSPECWEVLERLGLARPIERLDFHPIHRVRVTTPRGRSLEAEVTGRDGRPGIGLSRSALDDLVVRTARAEGVEVFEGTRVSAPIVRDGRVAGLVARRGADETIGLRADVTIAADGRHSVLVARTGRTRSRSRFRPRLFGLKRHLAVSTAADDPADLTMEPAGTVGLHLVPGGYVGACRVESGMANLCGLLPEAALKRHRGDLDRLADHVFHTNPVLARLWDRARPSAAWKTVAGVRVESSSPEVPGILYAGDCQGTIDPLGGQGMTMALLGAEMLAPFVQKALAGSKSDRCAGAALQAEYADAWHRRFDRRVNLCRAYHHLLVNPAVVDVASAFQKVAGRLLSFFFEQTRDRQAHPETR
jgi:flavin-dependent dehydrogenase